MCLYSVFLENFFNPGFNDDFSVEIVQQGENLLTAYDPYWYWQHLIIIDIKAYNSYSREEEFSNWRPAIWLPILSVSERCLFRCSQRGCYCRHVFEFGSCITKPAPVTLCALDTILEFLKQSLY